MPAALSVILNNAFRVIDQYFVQWIGTAAQAAIGSCTFVLIAFFALYSVVSAGAGPLLARAIGAQDAAAQGRIFGRSLVGAVVIGVVVLLLCGFGAGAIVATLGLEGEAAAEAETYLRWLALAGLPLTLSPLVDAAFISMGRAGQMMGLQVVATVLNGLLNWLFIYELGMGIKGAALASGLSRGVALVPGFWLLFRALRPTWADFGVDGELYRVVRVGLPIGLNTGFYAGVYWALLHWAISPLGPEVNAALGIGFSALEGFTWPLFHGISLAVASLVGRHLGAGQPDQAMKAVRLGLPIATAAGLGSALVFYFGAEPLCGVFTEDPAVLEQAVIYAHILAFSQLFVAWEALSEGVLGGAGDTRTVLWWSAPLNLLRVPLGWALALPLGLGAAGVWWAINLTTCAKAMGKGQAVLRGRWTRLEV